MTGSALHALGAHDQARNLFEQIGDRLGQARALCGLGETALVRGDYAADDERYGAARGLFEQVGDRRGQAHVLYGLGETALVRGDYAAADERYGAARGLSEQIGDRYGQAQALRGLGQTALGRGDGNQARTHLAHAADVYDALGLTDLAHGARRHIPTA